jgi:hypothetical protein
MLNTHSVLLFLRNCSVKHLYTFLILFNFSLILTALLLKLSYPLSLLFLFFDELVRFIAIFLLLFFIDLFKDRC